LAPPEAPAGSIPPSPVHHDNIWTTKPWWCQPWSIVLTGLALPLASWLLLARWWITAPLAGAVLAWWWLFLLAVPRAYARERGHTEPPHRQE